MFFGLPFYWILDQKGTQIYNPEGHLFHTFSILFSNLVLGTLGDQFLIDLGWIWHGFGSILACKRLVFDRFKVEFSCFLNVFCHDFAGVEILHSGMIFLQIDGKIYVLIMKIQFVYSLVCLSTKWTKVARNSVETPC